MTQHDRTTRPDRTTRSARATRPDRTTWRERAGRLTSWRTVDLVTAAMLGVAFGVAYWGWNAAYLLLSPLFRVVPPAAGVLGGPWLLAGVVAALVVRKPGAALIAELLAANVEYLLGNQWGLSVLIAGSLQGLGVEIAVAVFLWRRWGPAVAALGGALAAAIETAYEYGAYDYATTYGSGGSLLYLATFAISGAVVAGVGGWLIVRALARTGALAQFAPGRDRARAQDGARRR
jgi:energy-coupling factor transport system substrate-specific component